jgi:hypothetical protein
MTRDSLSADHAKARIAQVAARLMAESGISDHALAKRKAARELGLPPGQAMPGNDEVDAALREYRALFDDGSVEDELAALRRQALEAMHDLEPFELVLVGGVANGALPRHADIEFELPLDSSKAFEQFLLNEGIDYEARDRGGQSSFLLQAEPANVFVRVVPENAPRQTRRGRDEPPSRLTRDQLRRLLDG